MLKPMRVKAMSRGYSVARIPKRNIDMSIVSVLKSKYLDEMRILDNWVLTPNRDKLKGIESLQRFLIGKYDVSDIVLYRGFSSKGIQNNLGLSGGGIFSRSPKLAIGSNHAIHINHPTSFTTDLRIALDFGKVTVKATDIDTRRILPLSDEVMYVLSEFRNLNVKDSFIETQREVIVLPDSKVVTVSVVTVNGKSDVSDSELSIESNHAWMRW